MMLFYAKDLAPYSSSIRLGFGPNHGAREELRELRRRLPRYRISVEFRGPEWLGKERDRERTLALLRDEGLTLICVDAPPASGLPHLYTATTDDRAIGPQDRLLDRRRPVVGCIDALTSGSDARLASRAAR